MKKIFILTAFVFATLACGLTSQSSPSITATPPPTATVTPETATLPAPNQPPATPTIFPDTPSPSTLPFPIVEAPVFSVLHMVSELDGWAISEQGILRTNDGGITWYDVSWPGEKELDFGTPFSDWDAAEAWVLMPEPQTEINAGTLYHTQDGGETWDAVRVPFGDGKLQFLDGAQGWMMANLGVGVGSMGVAIFQTEDSGLTWQQVYTNDPNSPNAGDSLPLGGLKNNLVAQNLHTAWIAGVIYAPDTIYLYKTTNGGETWELQPLPAPPDITSFEAATDGPILLSENDLILPVQILGEITQTGIYFSKDGGQSWEFVTLLPGSGRVGFPSPSNGFFWSGEDFYGSEDGGQTWSQIPSNTTFSEELILFDFVNANTGWSLTLDEDGEKVLYKTADGGVNWVQLSP